MAKVLSAIFPSFPVGEISEEVLTRNESEVCR